MVWWKASDDLADRPAVLGLSDSAFRLYVEGSLRCSRFLSDGRLDGFWVRQQIAGRWHGQEPDAELVAAGLWERTEGGYFVVDFLKDQPSKAAVEARRESEKLKKQAQRGKRPAGTTMGTPGGSPGTGEEEDLSTFKNPDQSLSISSSSRTPVGCPAGTTVGTPKTLEAFQKTTGQRLFNGQVAVLGALEAEFGEGAVLAAVATAVRNNADYPLSYMETCLREGAAQAVPPSVPTANPFAASQARIDRAREQAEAHEAELSREPLEVPA